MIHLDDTKDYYILVDGQGGCFGGNRIYESIDEVVEQFQEWAEQDEYEDSNLIGWTIGDCISNWIFELKEYNGIDWVEASNTILDYEITKKYND